VRAKDALGRFGEEVAARYLAEQGMQVVDRNWRCDAGELDIVAVEGTTLVVCEVKTRRTDRFGAPVEAVTAGKAARLRRLAARWLAEHPDARPVEVRIDIVGVLQPHRGAATVDHRRGDLW
jgi:putative endonuclease